MVRVERVGFVASRYGMVPRFLVGYLRNTQGGRGNLITVGGCSLIFDPHPLDRAGQEANC